MKASELYSKAENKGMIYEANCTTVSIHKWERLMHGAVKANPTKIEKLLKAQFNELFCDFGLDIPNCYNPYREQSKRTKTHLIYIHSGIEYFFKINN